MVPGDAHVPVDLLALHALGEDVEGLDAAHLAACRACGAELASLRGVVDAARSAPDARARRVEEPPARVWDAVAAELALGAAPARPAGERVPPPPPVLLGGARPDGRGVHGDAAAAGGHRDHGDHGDHRDHLGVVRHRRRPGGGGGGRRGVARSRAALLAVAAGVVGVVAGAGGSALLRDDPGGPAAPPVAVEARAELAPLPERTGTGEAVLERGGDGRRLVVTASGLSTGDGYTEVWLLDAEAGRLVSLGVLQGGSGSFPVPESLDIGDYPLVDLSLEPFDGDPAHSSDSIVRGELRA
ncbi:anti-sigma factor [Vallicoccus soli]|uniref:Anti-sigma factor n=1 Tax=Vallicoccus soli TaxID=2339232 RepID=A0A3A3YR43_9ACTN|nr:anti-sigma factor [Vallicoccus soli]RJK93765.1 anti-sigma factor [Vallicoccus soli]